MGDYIQEDTRLINLYSQSATTFVNGSKKSDVMFNFKNILTEDKDIIHTTVGIVTAQIPVSYYTINEYNNKINFVFDTGGPPTDGQLTLTYGNYNATSFITEFIFQMTSASFPSPAVTINKITGRLTFNSASSFTFFAKKVTALYTFPDNSTAFDVLGFDTNTDYTSSGGQINAPFPLNLLGIQQLRINSSAFASYNSNSTTLGESNLIGVVQSTAPPFGMILYNNQTSYSILKSKRIGLIDIQILDENGNLIDFNGIDWTLTIQLTIFRRVPLPDNSTAYLRPILQTLSTIQMDIANQAGNSSTADTPAPPDANDLAQQELLSNDSTSLDIMLYNHLLPEPTI